MIVGINITSIKARSNADKEISESISVNSTPVIDDLEKKDVMDLKDLLCVKFGFKVSYQPDVGEIKFEGEVLYKSNDTKNIIKKWKETKILDPDLAVEIFNVIFRKCLNKAIELSEDLRLPPPIRFPTVRKGSDPTETVKGDE